MTDTIFKPGVEYRTRDGRRARIYATDAGGDRPIHGAVLQASGEWVGISWPAAGQDITGYELDTDDLMPPEPAKERFLLWGSKAEGADNGHILEVEIQPDGVLKAVR